MVQFHTIDCLGHGGGGMCVLCDRGAELGWKDYWFVRDAASRTGFLVFVRGRGVCVM